MEEKDFLFPEEIYPIHLTSINKVHFTHREIDVISCLLNARRTNQIASILSIAPRTVTTHFRNIMLRLDCNSQEGIISFIEKSHKLHILREYYASLVTKKAFEESLKEVSRLKHEESPQSLVIYWKNQIVKDQLLSHLIHHFDQAHVKAEIREYNNDQKIEIKENAPHILLLLLKGEESTIPSREMADVNSINIFECQNYYFAAFEILSALLPKANFKNILAKFESQYKGLHGLPEGKKHIALLKDISLSSEILSKIISFSKGKKWLITSSSLILGIFATEFLTFKKKEESIQSVSPVYTINQGGKEETSIRSDLIIPTESAFLSRPKLIAQINSKLKDQNGIQTIALAGPGGAGKTTLARHYAHQQTSSVIWEINAETPASLASSFESLSQAFAKTAEDKKILKEIQGIKYAEAKEGKIIQFVKEHLSSHPHWFLIFDNVEKFADIQKYFPFDFKTWGQGKIILTTRDSNIENNKHINSFIQIGELTSDQKVKLFIKIMNHQNEASFTPIQAEEVKAFLEHIPSFPLDVYIAAYYLKSTNISYKEYIRNLKERNKNFENFQETIVKDTGNYSKTRFSIITLSLQRLINFHKDFADLLLFTSLLDSQNIPRDLLDQYKGRDVVDNFIYHLKKYSLSTNGSSSFLSTFSIHRNTQAIALDFLIKTLSPERRNELLQSIVTILENYISEKLDQEDLEKIRLLVEHYEMLLSHKAFFTDEIKGRIGAKLAHIYYYTNKYIKGKRLLEESLLYLHKNKLSNPIQIAHVFSLLGEMLSDLSDHERAKGLLEESLAIYKQNAVNPIRIAPTYTRLGDVHRRLGDYEKAKNYLEESLSIYQTETPNLIEIIKSLSSLGIIYKELGSYEKAKNLLEQSYQICKKHFPGSHVRLGLILQHLGAAYSNLGDYEKAKLFSEQGFNVFAQYYSNKDINFAWGLLYLGNAYRNLSQFQKAKALLDKSLEIHKKVVGINHIRTAHVLISLAHVYSDLGKYEKAKSFIEKGLIIYGKTYGNNHIEIAKVIRDLGQVHFLEGNTKIAEKLLRRSLDIFQQSKHPESYTVLECLASLYLKKSGASMNNGNIEKFQALKKQAIECLKEGLEIAKTHFPENSPHIVRIKSKLKKFEKETIGNIEKIYAR